MDNSRGMGEAEMFSQEQTKECDNGFEYLDHSSSLTSQVCCNNYVVLASQLRQRYHGKLLMNPLTW